MLANSCIPRILSVASLFMVSSLAQAGSSGGVIVAPGAVGAGAATATSVPTLSSSLLIVLGILLAVVAFRTLRSNNNAQKLLSILVMGGGLVLGGFGVDRVIADLGPVTISEGACSAETMIPYNTAGNAEIRALQNDCPGPMEVKGFATPHCPPEEFDLSSADCKAGAVLPADGGQCSSLPKCVST